MPAEFQEALTGIRKEFELFHKEPFAPIKFAWDVFWELRRTKNYDEKITHLDIKAYSDLYGVKFNHWEIQLILRWDIQFNSR